MSRTRVLQGLPFTRSPRALGILGALIFAGALVGATSNAAPDDRFVAEALIAVQPDPGATAAERRLNWQTAADAVRLPAVISPAAQAARQTEPVEAILRRVSTAGTPGSTVLRVRARDRTAGTAQALADAVASRAVLLLATVNRKNLSAVRQVHTFSFEDGTDGWSSDGSTFSLPPLRLVRDASTSHGGSSSLRADCGPRAGCGPSVRLPGEWLAGVTYRAQVEIRGSGSATSRARLVLGSNSADVTTSQSLPLRDRWSLGEVSFRPLRTTSTMELGVQMLTPGPVSIFVDDVVLAERPDATTDVQIQAAGDRQSTQLRARRAAAGDRYSVVSAGAPAVELRPHTGRSALTGGLAGFAVGVAGLIAAEVARRRRERN